MHVDTHREQKETGPTLLELVLQLHGEFRRSLEPLRVTPLQAGMLLFLHRHAEARVTDAATALRLRVATLSEVVSDLIRKRWVTKRRSVTDTRVVHMSLSRRGEALARHIELRVRHVEATLTEHERPGESLGPIRIRSPGGRSGNAGPRAS
jgi:DNA-binding MarR family transcriptional regulator